MNEEGASLLVFSICFVRRAVPAFLRENVSTPTSMSQAHLKVSTKTTEGYGKKTMR